MAILVGIVLAVATVAAIQPTAAPVAAPESDSGPAGGQTSLVFSGDSNGIVATYSLKRGGNLSANLELGKSDGTHDVTDCGAASISYDSPTGAGRSLASLWLIGQGRGITIGAEGYQAEIAQDISTGYPFVGYRQTIGVPPESTIRIYWSHTTYAVSPAVVTFTILVDGGVLEPVAIEDWPHACGGGLDLFESDSTVDLDGFAIGPTLVVGATAAIQFDFDGTLSFGVIPNPYPRDEVARCDIEASSGSSRARDAVEGDWCYVEIDASQTAALSINEFRGFNPTVFYDVTPR